VIDEVNTALMEMQAALLARSLYPEAHPRIKASEEEALSLLQSALGKLPEIMVFVVDDRVIFDNRILPSSSNLADMLFRMLQLNGVDQITFKRGLEAGEINEFLDALASTEADQTKSLEPGTHLIFGSLREMGHDPSQLEKAVVSALSYADEAAEVLPGVWDDLSDGNGFDSELLGDVVSCLSKVVSDSAGTMLSLAPLKRHDEYTFVHTINVAILSAATSEAVGLDGRAVNEITIAALLHDVGKGVIPEEVLNKPGRFTEDEFRLMQTHPTEGARILLNTPGIPELAPVVAYEHHVRADGNGYPRVPRGWKLNLASRIVQLADVFDALRTNRPYRPSQPVPKIVEIMKHDVGTFFDADLLRVFFEDVVSRGMLAEAPRGVATASS
jgi:HD-GYP domain-containing protein (c-di-GMP phosphodiesterase class II)